MKKIAIIGAGPAGLTAAHQLCARGFDVELFDSDNAVGGMSKTLSMWGQLVDLGPHRFFSNDPRVNQFWLDIIENEYSNVNRLTRIFYENKFYFYPLKAFNALGNLGLIETFLCIFSYIKIKIIKKKKINNFEDWVTNAFGKRLFNIFFKSYSEKLWGISCKEIDSDFAAQRIKKLSLLEAIKSTILKNKKTIHKTLVDEFRYPHLGTGYLYEKIASRIKNLGATIHLNTRITKININLDLNKKITLEFNNKTSGTFDHVISSMPINLLVKGMGAPDNIQNYSNVLKFRNTILVYLKIDSEKSFPDQWIYVHSTNLKTGRITNFKNWAPGINRGHKETILCLEYWCYEKDGIWSWNDEKLISLATDEIYKTKLISENSVKNGQVVRVPKCYPVYSLGYKENLIPIQQYLSKFKNLTAIGRYGSFKYNNQDHSILMGLLAAENITDNKNHDLWQINTDYEYQETSKINN